MNSVFPKELLIGHHEFYLTDGAKCLLIVHVFLSMPFVDGAHAANAGSGRNDDDLFPFFHQCMKLFNDIVQSFMVDRTVFIR